MRKFFNKWQLWYWVVVLVFFSWYIFGQQYAFENIVGLFYFLSFTAIFLIVSIISWLIKDRLVVVKNWKFWLWIVLLSLSIFLLLHFFILSSEPEFPVIQFTSQPDETNANTFCNTDEDCWCLSFTGSEFIPGEKVPHNCNLEANRCWPCYYE